MPIITPGASAGGAAVLTAETTTLTNAQVLDLAATPVTVVAAQGAGTVVVPVFSVLEAVLVTAYSGITAYDPTTSTSDGALVLALDALNNFNVVSDVVAAANLLTSGDNRTMWATVLGQFSARVGGTGAALANQVIYNTATRDLGGFTNAALSLAVESNSAGPIGGGAAGNSLSITVLYAVVTA